MPISSQYVPIVELAKAVGAYQKTYFRTDNLKVETKSTAIDMVTEVDIACDQKIVKKLKSLFPEDNILSEEQGYCDRSGAYTWIIDPLDGTTNFSVGLPVFAVSIARFHGHHPVFGVVYVPMLDELFVAEKGKGSYLNGSRLHVSQRTILSESVLATGFPYDRATAVNNNSKNIETMVPLVKGIRRMGAAAYDICLVGAGILDGFWELKLGKWDIAAAWLVVTEAGGAFFAKEGEKGYNVICGNKALCDAIDEVVDFTGA
ncbi:inositol monophosphatase family protein [Fusibacter sp. JL298sf-3]